jgi:isopenicillin-N epimerase
MDQNVSPSIENDFDWRQWRDEWSIRADTTYLNHGSFGPTPRAVRDCQLGWQQWMVSQPMDFFVRQFEPAWLESRRRLSQFVGTSADNLAFVENSTAGMNVVASTFSLQPDDEVLLTDHEYGAVQRIWRRACQMARAADPVFAALPKKIEAADQVVDAIFSAATERTRLIIVSHVTSPTAIILPIRQIGDEARRRGIAVCVDGPHAPAQVLLAQDELPCDFYTASLHKWLSAPLGSGFLYVAPRWQDRVRTPVLSWGRVAPTKPSAWWEEFVWTGTRDSSAYLAVPAAIELLERVGLENFRARTHHLARYARQRLVELIGLEPQIPDSAQWYGSMVSVPLPPGDARALQKDLWQDHGIEVPVIDHNGGRSIRVSCHLYNSRSDIDILVTALSSLLPNR